MGYFSVSNLKEAFFTTEKTENGGESTSDHFEAQHLLQIHTLGVCEIWASSPQQIIRLDFELVVTAMPAHSRFSQKTTSCKTRRNHVLLSGERATVEHLMPLCLTNPLVTSIFSYNS